jgi:hypothetical protein
MVFAVQCPEPRCRKYMLVEEHDRGTIVPCLICKTPIRVGSPQSAVPSPQSSVPNTIRSPQLSVKTEDW